MTTATYRQVPEAQLSSTRMTGNDGDESPLDTIKSAVADAKQNAEILAWCNNQYNRCKNARIPTERKWYTYLAFYFGRHNIQVIRSSATVNGFQLYVPKAPPWRVRLVINRIRLVIRKQVATLCQQKPRFFTIPASTSDEDLMSCRVAEAILDNFYREGHMRSKTRSFVWWGSVCGTSFVKTYWDKGLKDANGTPGQICSEVIAPFYIYVPDLLQPDIEKQPYVIHATTMSPETAKNRYKLDVAPNCNAADNVLEDQFLNMIGVVNPQNKNQVLNLEFWIKPGMFSRFPRGAFITICGDQVAQFKEGNPYEHGQFPFAKFTDMDTGAFYGESIIADLLAPQREFNRTRSQIVESKNLMAKPKILAQRGSVNASAITSEPGQVVFYTPGFEKPMPIPLTPLPAYVLEEVNRLQADMEDLSGQHDISRLISSRTSATALSYVQNADALVTSSDSNSIEDVIEKIGTQVIALVKQFWNSVRIVKVVGLDDSFEAEMWSGSDITDHTEIYVESGSALPQDRAGRQALLMDLLKFGVVRPEQMLELLDIGGLEKVYEDYLIDKRQAQRENLKIIKFAEGLPDPNTDIIRQLALESIGVSDEQLNAGGPDLDSIGTNPVTQSSSGYGLNTPDNNQ